MNWRNLRYRDSSLSVITGKVVSMFGRGIVIPSISSLMILKPSPILSSID